MDRQQQQQAPVPVTTVTTHWRGNRDRTGSIVYPIHICIHSLCPLDHFFFNTYRYVSLFEDLFFWCAMAIIYWAKHFYCPPLCRLCILKRVDAGTYTLKERTTLRNSIFCCCVFFFSLFSFFFSFFILLRLRIYCNL